MSAERPIGLTADQVTGPVDNLKWLTETTRKSTSGSCDFFLEAITAREKLKPGSEGYFLEPEYSADAIEFLKKNRPQLRLFYPQNIFFLKSEPGVEFNYEKGKKGEYEWWCFFSKFQEKSGEEKYSLLLRLNRGKVPWYHDMDPYLIVSYSPAAYADGSVTFSPHVENDMCPGYGWKTESNGTTKTEISDQKKWEEIILKRLGLEKHVVKQGLNFEVNDFDVKISLKKS